MIWEALVDVKYVPPLNHRLGQNYLGLYVMSSTLWWQTLQIHYSTVPKLLGFYNDYLKTVWPQIAS